MSVRLVEVGKVDSPAKVFYVTNARVEVYGKTFFVSAACYPDTEHVEFMCASDRRIVEHIAQINLGRGTEEEMSAWEVIKSVSKLLLESVGNNPK